MAPSKQSRKICHNCKSVSDADAKQCTNCGASLDTDPGSGRAFIDDDPALRYVDPNNRVELDRAA